MRYLTDRKRATGTGASRTGTAHHWSMTLSSVALAFLVPGWVYLFGTTLGQGRTEVLATFARPLPAILTALVLVVGMRHFAKGATVMIEDYLHGSARKFAVIFVISLATLTAATGLFAIAKIAL